MKRLQQAAEDLSKTVDGFANWWSDMDRALSGLDTRLQSFSESTSKLKIKGVKRCWAEIQGDYKEYKREVCGLSPQVTVSCNSF